MKKWSEKGEADEKCWSLISVVRLLESDDEFVGEMFASISD